MSFPLTCTEERANDALVHPGTSGILHLQASAYEYGSLSFTIPLSSAPVFFASKLCIVA